MGIIAYCKIKSNIWDGIIYIRDNKTYITNGVAEWELTSSKIEKIQIVKKDECDIEKIKLYLSSSSDYNLKKLSELI